MAELEFTNKLLKEAIADAEAVRQTAIENAKLSLEETFAPHIQSMLERNLRYEAEGMEEASEVPHEDGEPEGSSEMPADSSDIGNGENAEPSDDAFDSAEDDMSGEGHTNSSNDWYEDWSEKDFDLAEVIKELEEDVNMLNEEGDMEDEESEEDDEESEDEDGESEEDDEESEDEDEESEDEEGEYPEGEPAGDEDSDEDIPAKSSGTGEKGAATFTLDEFVSMMQEAGYNMEEVFAPAQYVDEPSAPPMEETDLNLEEILAELEAEDAEGASEEMASEVQALQEQLAEYRTAVNILRGKLFEVNLLNAKLLYTNKIFRKEGLRDDQKITIVENFDRATTVREVKMVYAVLAESLVPLKSVKNGTAKATKKIVAEGLASKPTPSTAPKATTPEIIAENSVARRLQQLAGIIS